jgi:L-ribulose-5-phosphate 3-epimerase
MKAAAHTMSTPQLGLLEALDLYAELGFDGVELLYTEDYPCALHPSRHKEELPELRERLKVLGLVVAQITPYAKDFDSVVAHEQERAEDEIRTCITLASKLECGNVRLWAGNEPEPGKETGQFDRLIDSLRELAVTAVRSGVSLNVENHVGSHGITSAGSVRVVEAVGAGMGITYDPGNLLMLGERDPLTALKRQLPYIRHVHFKDLQVLGHRKHRPTLVGQGHVPWQDLMPVLARAGFDGYFSTEFEKRWHPEILPDSRTGLASELASLRKLWQEACQ